MTHGLAFRGIRFLADFAATLRPSESAMSSRQEALQPRPAGPRYPSTPPVVGSPRVPPPRPEISRQDRVRIVEVGACWSLSNILSGCGAVYVTWARTFYGVTEHPFIESPKTPILAAVVGFHHYDGV